MTFSTAVQRLRKAARIILVGAPGVGKGTQSDRLIKRFPQLSSIATGDLLREHVKNKTSLGEKLCSKDREPHIDTQSGMKADSYMKSGGLVPDPLILNLILSELTNRGWLEASQPNEEIIQALERGNGSASAAVEPSSSPDASFILDGFPRTASQAETLSHLMSMNLIFHLVTPVEIILSRMANRWTHPGSGRVYNVGFNDPKVAGKDDITGEALVQRDDDSEETWRKRLAKFEDTSSGLLDFYRRKDSGLVVEIQGDSSDAISPQIFAEVERRFS